MFFLIAIPASEHVQKFFDKVMFNVVSISCGMEVREQSKMREIHTGEKSLSGVFYHADSRNNWNKAIGMIDLCHAEIS